MITTYLRSGYLGGDIDITGDKRLVYVAFITMLALAFYVWIINLIKGRAFKDPLLYDMAYGKFARFLFIPILFTGGMTMIPLIYDLLDDSSRNETVAAIVALIFNLICIGSFIFIYCMMPACGESKLCFVFKKCFVSSCIAYQIFFFFNNVITIAYMADYPELVKVDQRHTGSWICICLFGLIIAALMFIWKDIFIGVMGLIFQIGFFVMSACDVPPEDGGARLKGNYISSIIFSILLVVEIAIVLILKGKEVLQ